MTTTPVLGIPEIQSQQSQPEITHNEALILLQAVMVGAEGQTNDPPTSGVDDGEVWVIGDTPTGEWVGRAESIAVWREGAGWRYLPGDESDGTIITMGLAQEGLRVWRKDLDGLTAWTGTAWEVIADTESGTFTPTFGFAVDGDLSITYANQTGNYVRQGKAVFVNLQISIDPGDMTYTTAVGACRIFGLPFTPNSSLDLMNIYALAAISYPAGVTALVSRTLTVAGDATSIIGNGDGISQQNFNTTNFPSGDEVSFRISGVYLTG